MGQARFVFNVAAAVPSDLPDVDAPRPVELRQVLSSPAICWRLLSPNNRQLGRSADLFDDLPACVHAVELFLAGLAQAELLVTRHAAPVRWTWQVLERNQVVAMSGRPFEAERQATRTLDKFLASAVSASVVPEVVAPPAARTPPCPDPLPLIERSRMR